MAPPLVGRRVHDVGVGGIELEIGDARVVIDVQHARPGRPAIGGAVDAAVAATRPERPLGRDEHDVRLAGIDQDSPDVLRLRQPGPLPGAPAVAAAVDAVTPRDVTAADVLAGAHPDDVGVHRVERDRADRKRRLIVEDRRPRRPGVGGLPDATRSHRDEPRAAVARVDGDVGNAPAGERGTDAAQREGGRRGPESVRVGGLVGRGDRASRRGRGRGRRSGVAWAIILRREQEKEQERGRGVISFLAIRAGGPTIARTHRARPTEDRRTHMSPTGPGKSIALDVDVPRRRRTGCGGLVFHVMNRSARKLPLFDGPDDYDAFVRILWEAEARLSHAAVVLRRHAQPLAPRALAAG